jgi:hypothetical protein
MKKVVLGLFSLLSIVLTYGQSVVIDDLEYTKNGNQASVATNSNTITDAIILGSVTINAVKYPVTTIEANAFKNCTQLRNLTVGRNITSIGKHAFLNCPLLNIIFLSDTPPTNIHIQALQNNSTEAVYIPLGCESGYASLFVSGGVLYNKTQISYIEEGKVFEVEDILTITNIVENKGVLRIPYGKQVINQASTNIGGAIEVDTDVLPTDKWSFVGAPFNGYKLEAIKPGTKDVSVSVFDYSTGNWSNDWATIETEVGAGEGFFLWSFANEATIFTTVKENYTTSFYELNNADVTVTKTLTTHTDGGNWMALANPYTFKLDVAKFLTNQTNLQGGVVYRFNGIQWQTVSAGEINLTEGFFVNFASNGSQTAIFKKEQRYEGTNQAKSSVKKDFMRLVINDGERENELLFTQNEEANAKYDLFDANKLFSPMEITEPYFVTDGVALVKEEVNTLPYTANLNIRNYQTKEVTITIDNIPEEVNVFLLDNGQDIKMNGGVEYTTTITEGENADRFQLLVKKQQRIERVKDNQITIKNNNRQITITSAITNLNIEVYNNLGQKVFATTDYNFTLDQVPAGSYVVKAYQGLLTQSQKIVIK